MLRIMSLNTHKGFDVFNRRFMLHELREAVRGISADIVFLQEVLGEHSGHARRHQNWPEQSQYEFLADSIWSSHAYGRNAVYPKGHHGNAILSKFPIISHENHDISQNGPERRGLLHAVIEMPTWPETERVHLVCVHMGLRERHRRRQLKLLCDLVESVVPQNEPVIVAGDFNDWRQQADRSLRHCGLREVFLEQHGRAARTFPARFPILRLDRIYVRGARAGQLQILREPPWSQLSDHLGLCAEILP